ncbi:MAG TPA: hypothetical protein VF369_00075 [candidate division Zixibacteria bacterium]
MLEKSVVLPEGTPIYVKLTTNAEGQVSLGIRIDGGNDCLLDPNLVLPKSGEYKSYTKYVGELV